MEGGSSYEIYGGIFTGCVPRHNAGWGCDARGDRPDGDAKYWLARNQHSDGPIGASERTRRDEFGAGLCTDPG
jgi:hypothetical protein